MKNLRIALALLTPLIGLFSACSSTPQRVVVDSPTGDGSRPSWVKKAKVSWNDGELILWRTQHTIKGNERLNGCMDLAKLDAAESLLTEMAFDIQGTIDHAGQSISEDAEVILGKVRSGDYKGRIFGMKNIETFYERYLISETERIDCFALYSISKTDFTALKRSVVQKLIAVDPRLREAINQKQIDFFQNRQPASAVVQKAKQESPVSSESGGSADTE